MLVLTRKDNETIVINIAGGRIREEVIVTVLEIKRNRVKIGIEAPIGIRILRGELLEHTAQLVGEITIVGQGSKALTDNVERELRIGEGL